jgi:hypothetical protein
MGGVTTGGFVGAGVAGDVGAGSAVGAGVGTTSSEAMAFLKFTLSFPLPTDVKPTT